MHKETHRQKDKDTLTYLVTNTQIDRCMGMHKTDRQVGRQIHTDILREKESNRQRETDRQEKQTETSR